MIKKLFDLSIHHEDQRIIILDYFRGLLMILVLLQHANAPGNAYILQFHMPAFFFLSGYTEFLINKEETVYSYIKSRFRRLIIPYFAFEALLCMVYAFACILSRFLFHKIGINIAFNLLDSVLSIFLCLNTPYKGFVGRLWFFPAMFFGSVFVRIIRELTRTSPHVRWGFMAILLVISYITSNYLTFRLPFAIDIAFLGAAFMLLGIQSGPYIEWMVNKSHLLLDITSLIVCSITIIIINYLCEPICLMYKNMYNDYISMLIIAFLGTLTFLLLSKWILPVLQKISFLHKLVMWYSINSLTTFPVHLTIKIGMIAILKLLNSSSWLILFASMLILNVPVTNFVNCYLPFLLQTRPISKHK